MAGTRAAIANVVLGVTLLLICINAFSVRLFSVLRYESMIHEFDPYFNFRTTQTLVDGGFHKMWNWFDATAWYPLGRLVGGTVYPGLMWTAGIMYWMLNALNVTINIRNMCVFTAPIFSAITSITAFFLGRICGESPSRSGTGVGLVAAALVSIVPGYISRSVAGSYDNEAVAIFAMVNLYYTFVKACVTGSMMWAAISSLAYYYMVSTWGGYVFTINLIPLYALALLVSGRFTSRLYVAYSTMYLLGTLLSMQFAVVGFVPVTTSEHFGAFVAFAAFQGVALVRYVRSLMSADEFKRFVRLFLISVTSGAVGVYIILVIVGKVPPWTGRFRSLLDPTYEPPSLINSVSEHQPSMWTSFFFDMHFLLFAFPAGVFFCFQELTDGSIFAIIYSIAACYFSAMMVRLVLVLAPAVSVVAAIAVSHTLQTYMSALQHTPIDIEVSADTVDDVPGSAGSSKGGSGSGSSSSSSSGVSGDGSKAVTSTAGSSNKMRRVQLKKGSLTGKSSEGYEEVGIVVTAGMIMLFFMYVVHCTYVTSEAYSSPSIVLSARQGPHRVIFDDFREAYWWLRQNTAEDAKIMSWWDYGYQLAAMANRTTIVDNNTWNNTHIATVGTAMASNEDEAIKIIRMLHVDYVLVIFGGMAGYSSDDINKFLWMIRIGGGVYPRIKEEDFYGNGQYRVDREASKTMMRSLMYKMCYYRFGDTMISPDRPTGFDRTRNAEIGRKKFKLKHIEESFTSEHWLVRIYKVLDPPNRDQNRLKAKKAGTKKRKTGNAYVPNSNRLLKLSPDRQAAEKKKSEKERVKRDKLRAELTQKQRAHRKWVEDRKKKSKKSKN